MEEKNQYYSKNKMNLIWHSNMTEVYGQLVFAEIDNL